MRGFKLIPLIVCASLAAQAGEYLVKLNKTTDRDIQQFELRHNGTLSLVSEEGQLFKWTANARAATAAAEDKNVLFLQKNSKVGLFPVPNLNRVTPDPRFGGNKDNPAIQEPKGSKTAKDPMGSWAMTSVNASTSLKLAAKGEEIIVAVTDTGVDYNHEDLINNMWRNPKEIAGDGIDNDENGYVDDVVGWDFASDDNKPFDYIKMILQNPGHGTHCAGVVGATYKNGLGASGVAPRVKIMALRFLNEQGSGDLANSIKAIDYAIKNGARVISASWGTLGEDKNGPALEEALDRANKAGILFVAAAGNGRQGVGFSNDDDSKPAFPASYDHPNIIAVAALDSDNELGKFSNWGKTKVDIGAPGVKVLSTVPGNKYQDTVIDIPGFITITWDGTSMAAPHVSGAAAAIWSLFPKKTAAEVKEMILKNAKPTAALKGKVVSNGRLDFDRILK